LPAQVREERKGDGAKEKHRKFEEKERKVEKGTKRPNAKTSRFDKEVDEFFESEKAGNSNRPSWFAIDVFRTGLQRDDFRHRLQVCLNQIPKLKEEQKVKKSKAQSTIIWTIRMCLYLSLKKSRLNYSLFYFCLSL
jgi:hypothetical protein